MRFLEAQSLLRSFRSDTRRQLRLCTSGRPEPLDLYVRAEFAARGVDAEITTLPFGTLQQYLRANSGGADEVLILFPWDLAPALDWRTGIPGTSLSVADVREMIAPAEAILAKRTRTLFYIPAPIPPVAADATAQAQLSAILEGAALRLGAQIVPATHFSLAGYLATGGAFVAAHVGDLGARIVATLAAAPVESKKVLITDLDGVMWSGVIGEDGLDGIFAAPEGSGYPHFLYQTLLRRLRAEGVLLAAVSKNDDDLARLPFRRGSMTLAEDDFVAILASYHAKSAQIVSLAAALNLPVDAMVFVDDNPVELAEVVGQLPAITTLQFPSGTDASAPFLHELSAHFPKSQHTAEDAARTQLYRTRLASAVPASANPPTVEGFLRDLGMRLLVTDRSRGERERAVQLINKTSQFNLNGLRISDEELGGTLARGGKLFTATLEDRNGTHGEILACVVQPDESISTLVMSCRVLQRRVEYAFLAWLSESVLQGDALRLRFAATERNTPIQHFLGDAGFALNPEGQMHAARAEYLRAHGDSLGLFTMAAAP